MSGHTLHFNAPKGHRIQRYFMSVEIDGLWYVRDLDEWLEIGDPMREGLAASSCQEIHEGAPKTLKAFRRYLRNRPECRGRKVTLANRYWSKDGDEKYNFDVIAKPVEQNQ